MLLYSPKVVGVAHRNVSFLDDSLDRVGLADQVVVPEDVLLNVPDVDYQRRDYDEGVEGYGKSPVEVCVAFVWKSCEGRADVYAV